MRIPAINFDRNHEDRKLWTVFEPLAEANEASCAELRGELGLFDFLSRISWMLPGSMFG